MGNIWGYTWTSAGAAGAAGGRRQPPPSAPHVFGSITIAYVAMPRGTRHPLGTPHPQPADQCPVGQLHTPFGVFGYQFVVWVRASDMRR